MVCFGNANRRKEEKIMLINDMVVLETNGLYYIFSQQGELKSIHYMPKDGQLLADFRTLDLITKATAVRWGIIKPKKKST